MEQILWTVFFTCTFPIVILPLTIFFCVKAARAGYLSAEAHFFEMRKQNGK